MARILVVEDNPANRKLAVLVLETGGHEVLRTDNARDAMDMARAHLPDLVLMDIQLPGVSGLEAARALKQDPSTAGIRIVALTALAMTGDAQGILAAGCDAYLAKPYRRVELLDLVGRVLASAPG